MRRSWCPVAASRRGRHRVLAGLVEALTGFNPDGNNGSFEWAVVADLLWFCVAAGVRLVLSGDDRGGRLGRRAVERRQERRSRW